jgi:mycothiol synthase
VVQTPRYQLEVLGRLDPDETAAVSLLVERATESDGVRPLSEHVSLHLRHGGDSPVRNLLLWAEPTGDRPALAGYAHLDVTDVVAGSSAELVVDPAWRGQGVGRTLLRAVLDDTPDGRLRLWAHGELPAAARLAEVMGLTRSRVLFQMRRSLFARMPRPRWAEGVQVRTFRPGVDDEAWLALNTRAFAGHPEQGAWTLADLRVRMAEPWFDPAGFFLATRTVDGQERLVGFHWTKVHGGQEHDHGDGEHGHEPIGEVYIVGVDPGEQGHGLGRALTLQGLHHMRGLGLRDAMLYVDADNTAAIRLYEALDFTRWDTDVMYGIGLTVSPGDATLIPSG